MSKSADELRETTRILRELREEIENRERNKLRNSVQRESVPENSSRYTPQTGLQSKTPTQASTQDTTTNGRNSQTPSKTEVSSQSNNLNGDITTNTKTTDDSAQAQPKTGASCTDTVNKVTAQLEKIFEEKLNNLLRKIDEKTSRQTNTKTGGFNQAETITKGSRVDSQSSNTAEANNLKSRIQKEKLRRLEQKIQELLQRKRNRSIRY